MKKEYILAVDEGTTGVKSFVYDSRMQIVGQAYRNIHTYYPEPSGVEQNALEIYEQTVETMREAIKEAGITAEQIAAAGITTQRATWTFWNKETGVPLRPSVVWSDTRACYTRKEYLSDEAFNSRFPEVEGQIFFTENHIPLILKWITRNEPEFSKRLSDSDTIAGTVDTWLVWKLTGGKTHATSISEASVTMFYSQITETWNSELAAFSGLNDSALPDICPDRYDYGTICPEVLGAPIPILSVAADQQAALFSQGCLDAGTAKLTIGTGFYVDINIGTKPVFVRGLMTGVAWEIGNNRPYVFEGYMGSAGPAIEWLKTNLGLIDDFSEMDRIAGSVPDSCGLYFIPALRALTSVPFHDPTMEGAFLGIRAETDRRHFVLAVMEGVAFASAYVLLDMMESSGPLSEMRVSGGVAKSDRIVQTLANVTDTVIIRGKNVEATSKGAAEIAAIGLGWFDEKKIDSFFETEKVFRPDQKATEDKLHYRWWKKALSRVGNWNVPFDDEEETS